MKITFIIASVGKQAQGRYVRSWIMEPLSLAVLSSLTPSSVSRVMYDDRIEEIPFDEATDLAAINVETYTAARAYQIAHEYRKRNVKVVLVGFHATLMPEEASHHADAVIVGEAEGVWGSLLDDLSEGRLKEIYRGDGESAIGTHMPDRSIFRGKGYPRISLVETGRGCRYGCEFCSVSAFFRRTYKARAIESIVQEIKQLKNTMIFFVDDNIGAAQSPRKGIIQCPYPSENKVDGAGIHGYLR